VFQSPKVGRMGLRQFAATLSLVVSAFAQPSDPCALALTETGRNRIYESSDDERFALAYRWSCRTDGTEHGLDTAFKMSKFIDGSSAGRYARREEFCEKEMSRYASRQATRVEKSLVVERALDNWLSCIALTGKGITITPHVTRTQVAITFERTRSRKGMIRGVLTDSGTECSGQVQVPGTDRFEYKKFDQTFAYQLPIEETFTMTCLRKPQKSQLSEGTSVYPETTITVVTSETPLVLRLEAEPVASETWATEIRRSLEAQAVELKQQVTRLETQLKATAERIPTKIEVRRGKDPGYGPNHNGFHKTCIDDKLQQVSISTMTGTSNGAPVAVLCGSLHLVPEPKN